MTSNTTTARNRTKPIHHASRYQPSVESPKYFTPSLSGMRYECMASRVVWAHDETVQSRPKCTTEFAMRSPTLNVNHNGVRFLNRHPSPKPAMMSAPAGCQTLQNILAPVVGL